MSFLLPWILIVLRWKADDALVKWIQNASLTSLTVCSGQTYTFTTAEGANGQDGRISVNYDGFIDDVSVGDILLVDGGLQSLSIQEKQGREVICQVVDGGIMTSR